MSAKGSEDGRRHARAWHRPSEIPSDTGTGQQIASMRGLVDGSLSGAEFARAWLTGRRTALTRGERLRAPLARILDDVFFILEDEYAIDPLLRGPDDLSDEALVSRIRSALDALNELDGDR